MQIIGTVLACVIAYFALSGFDIATLAKAAFVGAVSVGAYVLLGRVAPSDK
jgi:hypothetical protein